MAIFYPYIPILQLKNEEKIVLPFILAMTLLYNDIFFILHLFKIYDDKKVEQFQIQWNPKWNRLREIFISSGEDINI